MGSDQYHCPWAWPPKGKQAKFCVWPLGVEHRPPSLVLCCRRLPPSDSPDLSRKEKGSLEVWMSDGQSEPDFLESRVLTSGNPPPTLTRGTSLRYRRKHSLTWGICALSQTGACGEWRHEGGDSAVAAPEDTGVLPVSPIPCLVLPPPTPTASSPPATQPRSGDSMSRGHLFPATVASQLRQTRDVSKERSAPMLF